MLNKNKKSITKAEEGNKILFLAAKTAICFGIIYGIYKFCKLKEEKEYLEKQLEEKSIKNWEVEGTKETWEGSKLTKRVFWKVRRSYR